MSLFETLLRPDHEDDPERSDIAAAANLLQVGEFQLLQLAYAEWFRREMTDDEASRYFGVFMVRGATPYWALHYARSIIELDRRGLLDEQNDTYHRYDCGDFRRTPLPDGVRRFIVATAIVVGAVGGGLAMASFSAVCDGTVLPPCFAEETDPAGRNQIR